MVGRTAIPFTETRTLEQKCIINMQDNYGLLNKPAFLTFWVGCLKDMQDPSTFKLAIYFHTSVNPPPATRTPGQLPKRLWKMWWTVLRGTRTAPTFFLQLRLCVLFKISSHHHAIVFFDSRQLTLVHTHFSHMHCCSTTFPAVHLKCFSGNWFDEGLKMLERLEQTVVLWVARKRDMREFGSFHFLRCRQNPEAFQACCTSNSSYR